MTSGDRRNWAVLAGTLAVTGGAAAAWLAAAGLADHTIRVPIRITAELAFMLYLVVLVARPSQQLLRRSWTAMLLANRRLVGVAFAAVMTSHLGLIVLRFVTQPDLAHPPLVVLVVGGGTFAIFYLMLITSFDGPRRAIGPRTWKTLHRTGLVLAGAIFGLPRSVDDLSDPDYLKFGVPFLLALAIRAAAWRQSRRQSN